VLNVALVSIRKVRGGGARGESCTFAMFAAFRPGRQRHVGSTRHPEDGVGAPRGRGLVAGGRRAPQPEPADAMRLTAPPSPPHHHRAHDTATTPQAPTPPHVAYARKRTRSGDATDDGPPTLSWLADRLTRCSSRGSTRRPLPPAPPPRRRRRRRAAVAGGVAHHPAPCVTGPRGCNPRLSHRERFKSALTCVRRPHPGKR